MDRAGGASRVALTTDRAAWSRVDGVQGDAIMMTDPDKRETDDDQAEAMEEAQEEAAHEREEEGGYQ